ncbi:MAG TPA: outer membrane protein transport protein [Verrucomicrobiae bacterium]
MLISWCAGACFALAPAVLANGIEMNGIGARSMSLGGADVAYAIDPLGAMGVNPAGLGFMTRPGANLGFVGAVGEGTFTKGSTTSGSLNSSPNGLPEGAFAMPLARNITLGLSSAPVYAANADWHYVDPLGGLDGKTSYGNQTDRSEILLLRSAIGLGIALDPKFSIGASFGVDYNQNQLQTPYIFQTQPSLKGAKTLLDLRTDGFGFDGQGGVLYRPMTNLEFGLSYQSETQIETHGTADGNAGTQFDAPSVPFQYSATVRNIFPQQINAGGSWGFTPQWRLALQLDWVDWQSAFKTLPVSLSGGSSAAINHVAGSSSIQDNIPLNWRNEFVYRAGLEYQIIHDLYLRTGYCYGSSPVPNQTLTPLTAAIMEHTFTAGLGYHWKRCQIDLAYQYDIPVTRNVGTSGLLSGEYSNSSVTVSMHWLALTIGVTF